jgi:hypothetical protein
VVLLIGLDLFVDETSTGSTLFFVIFTQAGSLAGSEMPVFSSIAVASFRMECTQILVAVSIVYIVYMTTWIW